MLHTNNQTIPITAGQAFQLPAFWANFPAPPHMPPGTTGQDASGSGAQQSPIPGIPIFGPAAFHPIIPLPPVPTPPPNLTALSEEELRLMEGDLRQAVEARIETLRRVQLLLDAAIAMMGQYQTAASTVT